METADLPAVMVTHVTTRTNEMSSACWARTRASGTNQDFRTDGRHGDPLMDPREPVHQSRNQI